MGVRKPVTVGSLHFERQQDAVDHFSAMLSRYHLGGIVEGVDAVHLNDLLAMHKNRAEKVGEGIKFFTTTISAQGSKCFAVMRVDGTVEGFSFHRCIKNKW